MYDQIASLLAARTRRLRGHLSLSGTLTRRPCAVLVPLVAEASGGISLLFTQRSQRLRTHPGHYAFPGGMLEETDDGDPYKCALREWHEELGPSSPEQFLGLLDDFDTGSGFLITPVVGWFEGRPCLKLSLQEVQEAFYVPLSFFRARSNLKRETVEHQGIRVEVDAYYWMNRRIWGATAGIVTNLMECLATLATLN